MHYYNQPLLDDFDQTGNIIRRKNKLKSLNLMNVSANFCDMETIAKIRQILQSLSPEEMAAFKDHLNNKKYLKRSNAKSEAQNVINQIAKIAVTATPKDEKLRAIRDKYHQNMAKIDKIKLKMNTTKDTEEMNILFAELEILNEKNVELFNKINKYNEKVFS